MDITTLQYAHYPLLRCSVAFLLFSIVCFLNYYSLHGRPSWKWLGFFIFFVGLHDVLHQTEPLIRDPLLVHLLAVALLGAAILSFLEVIYEQMGQEGRDVIRARGVFVLIIVILLSVAWQGWDGIHVVGAFVIPAMVMAWIFVGLPGFLDGVKERCQKSFLRLGMIFMGLYVLTLVIMPSAGLLPGGFWTEAMFLRQFGLPASVLRGIFIMTAAVILWICHVRVVKQRVSEGSGKVIVFWERIFFITLGAVLLTGWFFVSWVQERVEADEKKEILSIARVVAAGVNPRWVEKLTLSPQDLKIPEALRLREEQVAFREALALRSDVRWIYLMVMRQGQVLFAVDSIPEDDPNYTAPGDLYPDAPEGLYEVFHDGRERVVGPYQDKWGTFISGFVPIYSFETGKVVGVEGVDVDHSIFLIKSLEAKLYVIGVLMLIVISMGGFFLWQIRAHEAEDSLRQAFENLRSAQGEVEHSNELRAQAELQMRDLVEAMPNPVFFKDVDGIYRRCNQAFLDYLGLPLEKIIGSTVFDAAPRDIAERSHQADVEVLARGGRYQYEGKVAHANGTFRDAVFYRSVLYYTDGRPRGIVGIILDITERKKIEQDIRDNEARLMQALEEVKSINAELKRTQDKLLQSEKLAAIGTLAAGVAHEINNPLGFIQGNLTVFSQYVQTFLELLVEHDKIKAAVDEDNMGRLKELKRHIQDIEDRANLRFLKEDVTALLKETAYGVERINKIVTGLQHFSYASHGEKKLVSVNDALEGIMNMVSGEVSLKAELIKEYGDVPLVEANEEQLKQVFINLLVNAAHAMKDRGVIRLKTYVGEGDVVVEVADTGCGISKAMLSKIFDPFFTTKQPGKGTGLGLSISYDIVKKHKGRIEVESDVGKGTTFRVFLPAVKII